uniref:Uncharacterized protein n=1 Tax=Rhizophora mucronata TaxID=61149 RepID=A0A2P2QRC9_RHIMU
MNAHCANTQTSMHSKRPHFSHAFHQTASGQSRVHCTSNRNSPKKWPRVYGFLRPGS